MLIDNVKRYVTTQVGTKAQRHTGIQAYRHTGIQEKDRHTGTGKRQA